MLEIVLTQTLIPVVLIVAALITIEFILLGGIE